MFWSIFLNSVGLILIIMIVGWGVSRLIENSASNKSNSLSKED